MVICLERDADLHMAQLMPLPLTVSCFSKSRLVLPFWYRLTRVVPEKGPLNGCLCVCGDDYVVNLKVVSKTTKCRDFTVILPVFFPQKCIVILPIFYRDFLTALILGYDTLCLRLLILLDYEV